MITKIAAYSAIYIIWGSTYYFIKSAVMTIEPFYVVGLRFTFGGVVLLCFSYFTGRLKTIPTIKEIINSIIIGIMLLAGGNGLVTVAEKKVDSYLAALLISAIPLVTIICDRILVGKVISRSSIISIVTGISGVILLLSGGAEALSGFSIELLLVVLAIILWSIGTSLSKQIHLPKDSVVNATIQILSVGLLALLFIQIDTPFTQVNWHKVSNESWFGLGYLATMGSLALVAYTWLLKHEPVERVVTYTFVNPLIAVALGILVGGEKAVTTLVPGAALVLLGLALMFYSSKIEDLIRVFTLKRRGKLKKA